LFLKQENEIYQQKSCRGPGCEELAPPHWRPRRSERHSCRRGPGFKRPCRFVIASSYIPVVDESSVLRSTFHQGVTAGPWPHVLAPTFSRPKPPPNAQADVAARVGEGRGVKVIGRDTWGERKGEIFTGKQGIREIGERGWPHLFFLLLNWSWSFDTQRTLVVVIGSILFVQLSLSVPDTCNPSDCPCRSRCDGTLSPIPSPSFPPRFLSLTLGFITPHFPSAANSPHDSILHIKLSRHIGVWSFLSSSLTFVAIVSAAPDDAPRLGRAQPTGHGSRRRRGSRCFFVNHSTDGLLCFSIEQISAGVGLPPMG
jgi:hypothetical protein